MDELKEADSNYTLGQIQGFSNQFHRNQFIITCRIAARDYIFEPFTQVEIADFDDQQIATFAKKWFHNKHDYVVAIRSNHGVWMPSHQRIRYNKWRKFDRIFADGTKQVRYIREVIYGKRRSRQYWEITTNPQTLPPNETWSVMTRIPDVKYHQVGNLYRLRNWVEYGLKPSKNELGWADFRLTSYTNIEKWWELVCSAYLLVSLHSNALPTLQKPLANIPNTGLGILLAEHRYWDFKTGWKNLLNNLRLIVQPFVASQLMQFWLKVFPIPELSVGLNRLLAFMNRFPGAIPLADAPADFHFFSA